MIARIWRGAVEAQNAKPYAAHLLGDDGSISDYTDVPGNRGAWVLQRDVDDRVEFMMFSLWESMDAIRSYAGEAPERAVFYEKDDRYLIERDETVSHFEVLGCGARPALN
jgi:heme-degrading monooxygenase HmoA